MTDEQRGGIFRRWCASDVPDLHRDHAEALARFVFPDDSNTPEPLRLWGHALIEVLEVLSDPDAGYTVVLYGDRGTGKTQLSVNAIREVCLDERSAKYVTVAHLFRDVRATYKQENHNTEKSAFARYVSPALLVIDEAHQRRDTEWENLTLSDVVNDRYAAKRDTVIVTNEDAAACEASLGESIVDRMQEAGLSINCNWPSFRGSGLLAEPLRQLAVAREHGQRRSEDT